jgi:phosphoribosylglycinamide formyltransferase-1
MIIEPIFPNYNSRKMRVALFISGSGTNGIKIIQRSIEHDSNFEVSLIFSDVKDDRIGRNGKKMCKAKEIAEKYSIDYEYQDIRDFYSTRGIKRTDLSIRPDFDRLVLKRIQDYDLDLIANAGYMSIMTPLLLNEYNGRIVNVHPADLSIMEGDKRKYVGIHVVEEAILAGETEIRSTTHIVREEVDHGEILIISEPIPIELDTSIQELAENHDLRKKIVANHQERLKEKGDWVIYPLTIQMISKGRFALGSGGVYLDGKYLPKGYWLG